MNKRILWLVTLSLTMGALMWLLLAQSVTTQETATVSGVVMELNDGPVAGAVVRQKTTTNATTSAEDGTFTLDRVPAEGGWLVFISAVLFAIFGSAFGALGGLGKYRPVLLILLGVVSLARAFMRPRTI